MKNKKVLNTIRLIKDDGVDFSKSKKLSFDFAKAKILLYTDKKVKKYLKEVALILSLLGHSEALVTDLSAISDFVPSDKVINKMSKTFGFKVKKSDLLIDIAKKIK